MRQAGRLASWAAIGLVVACGNGSTRTIRDGPIDTGLEHDAGPLFEERSPSPIELENQNTGTSDWVIAQPAQNREVEGYASATSAAPGEEVALFVSVSRPHHVHWELYRLGYYGGLGGRSIARGAEVAVSTQAPCPVTVKTGLVECAWKPTFTLTVPSEWLTGQYLVKLVRDDGFSSYVPLVVRESTPRAAVLYQSGVTTWQAYNAWGGTSLYANQLPQGSAFHGAKAARVSFDRPYQFARPFAEGHPETELGAGQLFLAEQYMLSWLEMKGYDVAYVTNVDIDADPELLARRRMFLVVGHDEYWTRMERAAVQQARDGGVSIGFFSANDAYWRILLGPSSSGVSRRVVTCYKGAYDPGKGTNQATGRFRDASPPAPEDALIGQMYEHWTGFDGFPLIVGDATHWVYAGTGVASGDTLPHLVGYEWDHVFSDARSPKVDVVASSPTFNQKGWADESNVTAYYPNPASVVFSAGTISWAWGLGKPGYADDRVAKMTENVLSRAGVAPAVETVVKPPAAPTDVGDALEVALVAGSGSPGSEDGVGSAARFNTPAGVAVDSSGVVYVTEARNHRVRKITLDGSVSTVAGCGPEDSTTGKFADGRGTAACFSVPLGIAVGPDGTLYVADSDNHRIRAIDATGQVTTFAGSGSTDVSDSTDLLEAGIPYPRSLAFGPDGALYVVSNVGDVRLVTSSGVTTLLHDTTENSGVTVAPDGTIYVVSTGRANISVLQSGQLVPLVNPTGALGDQGGPGGSALLRPAEGVSLAWGHDAIYFSDSLNYKVRRLALGDHTVSTFVGSGLYGAALGTGATARVVNPRALVATPFGVIIADSGNHRILRAVPRSQATVGSPKASLH